MAKTATLKAKDVLGKDFTIIDSMNNIKKINAGMKAIYKSIDDMDKKNKDATFADYNDAITEEVVKQVSNLLNLNKEDSEKLSTMSYSEMFDFYSKAVNDFTGMHTPSVREMQNRIDQAQSTTNEDPK